MTDFVLILSLLYCWPFSGSVLVLVLDVKKKSFSTHNFCLKFGYRLNFVCVEESVS